MLAALARKNAFFKPKLSYSPITRRFGEKKSEIYTKDFKNSITLSWHERPVRVQKTH